MIPEVTPDTKFRSSNNKLTRREIEVAQLACKGLTSKEIADIIHISKSTVDFHLLNTYRKLGINSRYKLMVKVQEGALHDPRYVQQNSGNRPG